MNQNFIAINPARVYLSVCFQAETSSKQIYPSSPERSFSVNQTIFPHKRRIVFPWGMMQEYFLSLCPECFSFTEHLWVLDADSQEM